MAWPKGIPRKTVSELPVVEALSLMRQDGMWNLLLFHIQGNEVLDCVNLGGDVLEVVLAKAHVHLTKQVGR